MKTQTNLLPGDHYRMICDAAIMLGHLDRADADRQIFDMQTENIASYLATRPGETVTMPICSYEFVTPVSDNRAETMDLWFFAVSHFFRETRNGPESDVKKWALKLETSLLTRTTDAVLRHGTVTRARLWITPEQARTVQPFRRQNVEECTA